MAKYRPIESGRLDRRGLIEQPTTTQNSSGEPIETWSTFARPWCHIADLSGRELLLAQQVASDVTTRIECRYVPGVTSKMRFKFGTTTYEIDRVINVEERNEQLEILCRKVA